MVSENISKDTINIVGVINQANETFCDIKVLLHNISGKSVNYSEISAEKILTLKESFLSEIDLVLVQNLSLDEYVSFYSNNSIKLLLILKKKCYQNFGDIIVEY